MSPSLGAVRPVSNCQPSSIRRRGSSTPMVSIGSNPPISRFTSSKLHQGYWPIALLVFSAAILAPALYLGSLAYISAACSFRLRLPFMFQALRTSELAEPWNLIPVYSIATVVSVVKLRMIGGVTWDVGARWVLGVAAITLFAQQVFDRRMVRRRLEALGDARTRP